VVKIHYPVVEYPSKVTSLNLDKTPEISGVLQGIKGQYLLLDTLSTSFLSILRQLVLSLTNAFKASSIFPDLSRVSTSSIGRAATAPWSIEALKAFVNDKTNWRKMLKNEVDKVDLVATKNQLLPEVSNMMADLDASHWLASQYSA
jgi:hypothetical protein